MLQRGCLFKASPILGNVQNVETSKSKSFASRTSIEPKLIHNRQQLDNDKTETTEKIQRGQK